MKKISFIGALCALLLWIPLSVSAKTDSVAQVGDTTYTSLQQAIENANGEKVTLLADSNEQIIASGDVYLDLNGHTLASITITDGTLYGMDTTTDDYNCDNGYGSIAQIHGDYAVSHSFQVSDNTMRYLAIQNGSGVSFHRIYVGVTHKSMQPSKNAVGYQAIFCADAVVQGQMDTQEAFGYTLWLEGGRQVQYWRSAGEFTNGKKLSLRINHYDTENYGQVLLHAMVQIQLKDGTVITSQEQASTLQQMVEEVNQNVADYTQVQLEAVKQWVISSDAMASWNVKNLLFTAVSYEMDAKTDLVMEHDVFVGNLQTVTVKGTELTLKNASLVDGVLTIPAASFRQDTMPTGTVSLVVTTDRRQVEFDGQFTWVILNKNELANMHKHLTLDGSTYTGYLALGANVDAAGLNLSNFPIFKYASVFDGEFDGRNYTITNLAPKGSTGLFGTLGEKGVVKNLNLTGVQISTYGGGVAYILKGSVENLLIEGSITGDGMAATSNLANFGCGLLAGQFYNTAKVRNCIVELSAIADNLRLATALGKLRSGTPESIFQNCYVAGGQNAIFMDYTNKVWTKRNFTADTTNRSFTDGMAMRMDAVAGVDYFTRMPLTDFVEQDTHDYTLDNSVHIYDITDTGRFLAQNGKSSYSIVLSKNADSWTSTAATEFAGLFRGATGVRLRTAYAESTTYSPDATYIVIGENAVSRAAGVTAEGVTKQGFRIQTVGNSIFVVGADTQGTLFGTYELLYQLFHFECFGTNGYSIDQNVKEVPLKQYNITDNPDIAIRRSNYHYLTMDSTTERRMRLTYLGNMMIPVNGQMVHNTLQYIDPADYPNKPEWFSTDGVNLCYTAHGNAEEMAQMQAIVADTIISHLKANPDKNVIGMMQADNATLCDCDTCAAMQAHYNGAQSASVIIFLNRVCQMVDAHFDGARDFTVLFFAYHATNQPPAVYNMLTGEYEPIDENVILNEHLMPYFADTDGDYQKDFYNTESANAIYAQRMQAWLAIAPKLYFWLYGTNFSFYLIPYNTFDAMQATYKYAAENNVEFIYDQGQSGQTGNATGWSNLKIYLYGKLTWNVDQDRDALIDRFMDGYYGPASDTVKTVFYQWKYYANYQTNVLYPANIKNYTGSRSIYTYTLRAWNWNPALLLQWTQMLEEGIQQLEPLKTSDPESYNKYLKNIATERIAYNYILLELFQGSMTPEQVETAKAQFYHDQKLVNIGYIRDRDEPVNDLLIKWGIIQAGS